MEWREVLSSLSEVELKSRTDVEKLLPLLRFLVHQSLQICNRSNTTEEDIAGLGCILQQRLASSPSSSSTSLSPNDLAEVWCEVLKLLRNLCVDLPSNQLCIIQHPTILRQAAELAVTFGPQDAPSTSITMVAMQLMGNVCVGQRSGREVIWKICFPPVFRAVFGGQSSCWGVACMLLHYCCLDDCNLKKRLYTEAPDIVSHVIGCLATSIPSAREWSALVVASLLSSSTIDVLWGCLPPNSAQRLLLLRFLLHSEPNSLDHAPSLLTPHSHGGASEQQDPRLCATNIMFYVDVFHKLSFTLCQEGAEELKAAHDYVVPSTQSHGNESLLREESVKSEGVGDRGALSAPLMDFIKIRICHTSLQLLSNHTLIHTHLPETNTLGLADDTLGLPNYVCPKVFQTSITRNCKESFIPALHNTHGCTLLGPTPARRVAVVKRPNGKHTATNVGLNRVHVVLWIR